MDGRWHGCEVFCFASGPSLTREDAESVRRWRDASPATRKAITVNTTHRIAPWADAVFALDLKWWQHEDNADVYHFAGAKFSSSFSGRGVVKLQRPFEHHGNSGAAAVSLAYMFGAARIYLLGYDCQRTGGKVHWHGDHPKGLGNAGSMPTWAKKFQRCAEHVRVPVINCTRSTALTCWPRQELEQVIG